jgi:hypothetical protein
MNRKSWILLLIAVVGILVAWKMIQREGFETSDVRNVKAKLLELKDRLVPANYPPIPGNMSFETPELMQLSLDARRQEVDRIVAMIDAWIADPKPATMMSESDANMLLTVVIPRMASPTGMITASPPPPPTSATVPSTSTAAAPPPSTTTPAPYVPSSTQPAFKEKGASIWGPAFTSFGDAEGGDSVARDPSTIRHPLLLGPSATGDKKLIDGIGVVESSTANLPSSAQTGSNEDSKYLPYSRVPGDQDLIPDPYRTSGGEFSTSSYSVKNEPVPFLTDFSAFMK